MLPALQFMYFSRILDLFDNVILVMLFIFFKNIYLLKNM